MKGRENLARNHYCCKGHYNTLRADTGERVIAQRVTSAFPITVETHLPEMRETPGEVDDQVEAEQLLIVDGVSEDVHGELAYVTVSQGCVSWDLMDAPGGISLGKSVVCWIT